MKTFEMTENDEVNLEIKISCDAIAGSNVCINDKVIRKSAAYNFKVPIGTPNDLNGQALSSVSNFFVANNLDPIFDAAEIKYILHNGPKTEEIVAEKVKVGDNIFMGYLVVQLVKI